MKREEFKVIVAGSRGFSDYAYLRDRLDYYLADKSKDVDIVIVSGTANGADKLGEKYAEEKGYRVIKMPAQWDKYGKRAGYLRNTEMAKISDSAVIFWDGVSHGSKHMYNIAVELGLQVRLVKYTT